MDGLLEQGVCLSFIARMIHSERIIPFGDALLAPMKCLFPSWIVNKLSKFCASAQTLVKLAEERKDSRTAGIDSCLCARCIANQNCRVSYHVVPSDHVSVPWVLGTSPVGPVS
jgi:hypothetical protein